MSSPSSELSWLSSDEIDALLEPLEHVQETKEQQAVWQNKWTPVNPSINTTLTAPPSPPSPQHDSEEDDEPSTPASHLRPAIIASADRLYETKTARKRKITTSPPSSRKRRVITIVSEDVDISIIQAQDKKPPAKKSRVPRKPRTPQPHGNDSLLPSRSSKHNTTYNAEKRTSSQAFETEIEPRPAKKLQTVRGREISTGQLITDSMVERNLELVADLKGSADTNSHSDIENTMQAAHEDSEDLFDNDDTYIEEFFKFESALFAETMSPSTSLYERLPRQAPGRTIGKLEKAPSNTNATPSPMKPFIRPFTPLPSSQDTSPAGSIVSPLHRSPTCFRIAEAIRYISHAFFTSPIPSVRTLNLELYAILDANADNGDMTILTLADIFFPRTPPYLEATAKRAKMALALGQKDKPSWGLQLEKLKGDLIRTIIQVNPLSTTKPAIIGSPISPIHPLGGRYTATVLKLEKTDWGEIEQLKVTLDRNTGPGSSSASNA